MCVGIVVESWVVGGESFIITGDVVIVDVGGEESSLDVVGRGQGTLKGPRSRTNPPCPSPSSPPSSRTALVGDLARDVLARGFLKHIACAIRLVAVPLAPSSLSMPPLSTHASLGKLGTHNLLVQRAVLVRVLAPAAAVLLLGSVEALVEVIALVGAAGVRGRVGVGVERVHGWVDCRRRF